MNSNNNTGPFFRVLAKQIDLDRWRQKSNSTHEQAPLKWYAVYAENPSAPLADYPLFSKDGGPIVYTENARKAFVNGVRTHGPDKLPSECPLAAGEVNGMFAYRTPQAALDYAGCRAKELGKLFVVFMGKKIEDKDSIVVPEANEGAILVQWAETVDEPMRYDDFVREWGNFCH